jgi:hypothetical protein
MMHMEYIAALDFEIDDPGVLVDLDTWKDHEKALKGYRVNKAD